MATYESNDGRSSEAGRGIGQAFQYPRVRGKKRETTWSTIQRSFWREFADPPNGLCGGQGAAPDGSLMRAKKFQWWSVSQLTISSNVGLTSDKADEPPASDPDQSKQVQFCHESENWSGRSLRLSRDKTGTVIFF